jgi:hypothetical protein
MNKILYIGASSHIEIVDDFPNVKEFIFVDTKPRTNYNDNIFNYRDYDKNFCKILINKCLERNFILCQSIILEEYWKSNLTWKQIICYYFNNISQLINPTLLIFINQQTGQKIKYYISTSILYNMSYELKMDIKQADGFIFDALFTHEKILHYFDEPKICIGYLENNYDIVQYNENTLINFLNNNVCSIFYYFREFRLVETNWKKKNKINVYNSFNEFKRDIEIKRSEQKFSSVCKINVQLCSF